MWILGPEDTLFQCLFKTLLSGLPPNEDNQIRTHFAIKARLVLLKVAWQPTQKSPTVPQKPPLTAALGLKMSSDSKHHRQDPHYTSPKQGFLSYLPVSWIPFAELIRVNKPAGMLYLYIPCIYTTVIAACLQDPVPPVLQLLRTNTLFIIGSFIFRSAACTWNDILDQDIDRQVSRTRLRPLARGALSTYNALLYNGVQIALGMALYPALPSSCVWYSLPSIVLIALYPLAKRVTNYPQVILGLTWSWGAVIGFPAMGVQLEDDTKAFRVASCLYGSGIVWTILYDMIYAHQDIRDDKQAGVKSIAIRFERNAKAVLSGLGAAQILLLLAAGKVMDAGTFYYLGCMFAAMSVGTMIGTVNLQSPSSCWWWFQNGCWLTGGSIALGSCGEYYSRSRH